MHLSFDKQTVYFTVSSPIELLMQKSYNSTQAPLDFYINGAATQIIYRLDDQANVTITGNTTLTGLTQGTHSINIYTTDTEGHWVNFDAATFNVTLPASNTKPSMSQIPLLAVVVLSIAVSAISITSNLRKRKKKQAAAPFYK